MSKYDRLKPHNITIQQPPSGFCFMILWCLCLNADLKALWILKYIFLKWSREETLSKEERQSLKWCNGKETI